MSVYLTIMGNMPEEASTVVRAKIGCTEVNAESRAAALQTGNPEKLHVFHEVPAIFPHSVEMKLHQEFHEFGGKHSTPDIRAALGVDGGTEWFAFPRSKIEDVVEVMDSYADLSAVKEERYLADKALWLAYDFARYELQKRHEEEMRAAWSRHKLAEAKLNEADEKLDRIIDARYKREKREKKEPSPLNLNDAYFTLSREAGREAARRVSLQAGRGKA